MKRQFTPRLAWFRPLAPDAADPLDGTGAVIEALLTRHDIDVFDAGRAHEFVWRHDRQPYDLPIYELANTDASAFIWPYLLRYPGLLLARSRWFHDSRGASLRRQNRRADADAELAFGGSPLMRAPLVASRLVAVASTAHARGLQEEYPAARARIRIAPIVAPPVPPPPSEPRASAVDGPLRVGVIGSDHLDVVGRALQRARDAGARVELAEGPPVDVLRNADAIVALQWSTVDDWPTAALAAMAAARPAVVMETEATADWPALDPQSWRPRDPLGSATPIVVSLDPRDEEHSLVLAIRRLAADAILRADLGAAGHAWWLTHAEPGRAADAWAALIDDALGAPVPAIPPGWPPHLRADGSETARNILMQMGVDTDIFA